MARWASLACCLVGAWRIDSDAYHKRYGMPVRRGGDMVGDVLMVTPTARNRVMSDAVSRAHVRVRWSSGHVGIVPEGGLVRA
jgi:hypothetical protein